MSLKTIGDGFIQITGIGSSSTGTIIGNLTVSGVVELPANTVIGTSNLSGAIDKKANSDEPIFTGNVGIGTTVARVALDIVSTSAILAPAGSAVQRPTGVKGLLRYNTTDDVFEGYSGVGTGSWSSLGSGGAGISLANTLTITGVTASDSWTVTTDNASGDFQVHVTPAYDITTLDSVATKATPNFTSATTISTSTDWPTNSGWTVTANANNATAWYAFDTTNGTEWLTSASSATRLLDDYVTVKYPTENKLKSFTLRSLFTNNNYPATFKVRGSNDGTSFVDVQSYVFSSWVSDVTYTFTVTNAHAAYTHWQLYIATLGNDAMTTQMREIRFNTGWSVGRIGLVSAYKTSTSQFKIVMADTNTTPVTMSTSPISWKYNIMITKNGNVVLSGLYQFNANNTFSKLN